MHVLYHVDVRRLSEVPAGTLVTDSREYAEYFGRIDCRRNDTRTCYIHQVQVDFHEVSYSGREPLGNANLYWLKWATAVRDVTPVDPSPEKS